MVNYKDVSSQGRTIIKVILDGKTVGTIHRYGMAWAYTPKGSKVHGDMFSTLYACQKSLEG